jgi:hypothetical protein
MRRLWFAFLAVGFLVTFMGCHHICGVCDCGECLGCGGDCYNGNGTILQNGPGDPPVNGGAIIEKAK